MNDSAVFSQNGLEIAIIGMAGRLPGSKSIEKFWQNLCDGIETVAFFSNEELQSSGVDPALLNSANYVKAHAMLEDIELFDASFFGFSSKEAEFTDPQHRIFLECAWEAIEAAGYDPEQFRGSIGVYAGASTNSYLYSNIYSSRAVGKSISPQIIIGNDKNFLTTQVSYKLNLKGPSVVVQTACSTSLVAVHLACQGLLSGECDIALAGGVSIKVPQKAGYLYEGEGIGSPDGHCRAFDAEARGTVGGSGVGIVVLKRLEDAIVDGDFIYAVIKGSAINNDGSEKIGYMAPSIEGQAKVIKAAQITAEVDPETITYVETHGTGTPVGDPIEILALSEAFRTKTQKNSFCAIGSVKTNIGHLDATAGIAGLLKTIMALKHRMIPPSLHFKKPNPKIDFNSSPFYVNTTLREWKTEGIPLRAGVSSFGIGGTNAHVILEEAPNIRSSGESRPWHLLVLSAKTESALENATKNLVEHLKQHPDLNLADVVYTLQIGRRAFNYRRVLVCRDLDDAVTALETHNPKRVLTSVQKTNAPPLVFMFPGVGAQYVNMASGLYQTEPTFRFHVDRCSEILEAYLGLDLREILFLGKEQTDEVAQEPGQPFVISSSDLDLRKMLYPEEQADETTEKLNQTFLAHPALFVIEYALAQLLMAWGLRPQAMIGHSIGEYVAACLGEVFSLEDALALVARRAQMIQELPGGAMLAVHLLEEEVLPLLGEELFLSAINEPSLCILAGSIAAISELERSLTAQGIACRRIQTSHAFHSKMMEPVLEPLTRLVKTIKLKPPTIPYVSNVTGTWITVEQATDPSYWAKHTIEPVRFADGLRQLWEEADRILLEVGPGQTLSSLAIQHLDSNRTTEQVVLSSLPHSYDRQPDVAFLLNTLGKLWLTGIHVDWPGFYTHEYRHRVALPTYPFERQLYWIEPQKQVDAHPTAPQASPEKRLDFQDWFYTPSWRRTPLVLHKQGDLGKQKDCWLMFVDDCGIGLHIARRLESAQHNVIIVREGQEFARLNSNTFTINLRQPDDYDTLFKDIQSLGKTPSRIVHMWGVTPTDNTQSSIKFFERFQDLGIHSLRFLTQTLIRQNLAHTLVEQNITPFLHIDVVSSGIQDITGEEVLCPEKATLLGPCKVIPQEYPNITCRNIDIVIPPTGTQLEEKLIDQIVSELFAKPVDLTVGYRGNHRWVQFFERVRLDDVSDRPNRLRKKGVYLMTGGLGKDSLIRARYLAQTLQARLVLIGRSGLPNREEWDQWLTAHNDEDITSTRIRKVQELENLGARVMVIGADVANEAQMRSVIDHIDERFGEINGVIHAAGITTADTTNLIPESSHIDCERHFQPKVYGLYVLEKVLHGKELDFCILTSSITAITGGIGLLAYVSANIFMDGFVHKYNRTSPTFWTSVNWHGLSAQETADAFEYILSMGPVTQVVVSPEDLQTNIDQRLRSKFVRKDKTFAALHSRPNLRNPYIAPTNQVEQRLVTIWQELLDIQQVGIHDNFFELGGNSLQGTRLISWLRREYQIDLPLRILFEIPTVAELASTIEEMLITEIEQLREKEAEIQASQLAVPFQYKIPNGLTILQLRKAETDHFYREIFEEQTYLKHGIILNDDDCIFDVGANIGLFTLFVHQRCKNAQVYAFEPAPPLFDILRINTSPYQINTKLLNCGLSNRDGEANLTFYPLSSGMSSFYADVKEEKRVFEQIMSNQQRLGFTDMEQVMEYSEELTEQLFKSAIFPCKLKTLSTVMQENNIECIDLLKLDVQKCELDVLRGIKEDDWRRIRQIVAEVHDMDGRLKRITNLLEQHGYNVVVDQDSLYVGSVMYLIYAVRS